MAQELEKVLEKIRPSELAYEEWLQVGMALKEEGCPVKVWEKWSREDPRYRPGECERKWETFRGSAHPVAAGYIRRLAGREKKEQPEETSYPQPEHWHPAEELIRYLKTLFRPSDIVGYVTASWERQGKKGSRWQPQRGNFDRTAGELEELLSRCGDDIGSVLGDYNAQAGAWIRINPLDGAGCRNENVTDYRYALVESDDMSLSEQEERIRKLELPVAALVYSGGRSLHAVVRIEAADYGEYRNRVEFLYRICREHGIRVDVQNKNPSRLSRMPGVVRNGRKQFLMDTDFGKASWEEWKRSVEAERDGLPEFESLESIWDRIPEQAPCLIEGILRQSHKMLISGPSKAGKSFLLIQLCIAIAEGTSWAGWPCAKGRVLYVNLELDRVSCLHRFFDVYRGLELVPGNLKNIDIWNLRGRTVPMDQLAPRLIRKAKERSYLAVIIDPIYKLITGDENSASQMAYFCGQFDRICTELGCAVIYSHHHSKGSQGTKRSIDRASGSGVFSRDPDALLDLIQLPVPEPLLEEEEDREVREVCGRYVAEAVQCGTGKEAYACCCSTLSDEDRQLLEQELKSVRRRIAGRSAWRMEGTLREFPKPRPINLWFEYPVHKADRTGLLRNVQPDGETPWKSSKWTLEARKRERYRILDDWYRELGKQGEVSIEDLASAMGVTGKTVRNYIREHGGYRIREGIVTRSG